MIILSLCIVLFSIKIFSIIHDQIYKNFKIAINIIIFALSFDFQTIIASVGIFDGIKFSAQARMRNEKRSRLSNAEVAQQYLEQMVDTDLTEEGFDIFKRALDEHDVETVKMFIGSCNLESENESKLTPLMLAVCADSRDVVQALMQAGANIEHESFLSHELSFSALKIALLKNRKDCAKDLICAGAQTKSLHNFKLLEQIQQEMNDAAQNAYSAYHEVRSRTCQKNHPMVQETIMIMLQQPHDDMIS